jgi:hypothetical protein
MKITTFLPIAFIAFCGLFLPDTTLAQSGDVPDPTLIKPPHVILQTGISSQWLGGENWRSTLISIEHPFGPYQHLGVEVNFLFPDYTTTQSIYYSYERHLEKGSYDAGLFYKIFLHGRLTGRKSNLYVAPEIKFGRRKFRQTYYNDVFPLPSPPPEYHYWESTTKFALRIGAQYHIGPAILEIALPIAIERFKTVNQPNNYNNYNDPPSATRLLLLPCLQFGIAL